MAGKPAFGGRERALSYGDADGDGDADGVAAAPVRPPELLRLCAAFLALSRAVFILAMSCP